MQLLTKCTKILLKLKLFKHSFKTFRMANTALILWKLQLGKVERQLAIYLLHHYN